MQTTIDKAVTGKLRQLQTQCAGLEGRISSATERQRVDAGLMNGANEEVLMLCLEPQYLHSCCKPVPVCLTC